MTRSRKTPPSAPRRLFKRFFKTAFGLWLVCMLAAAYIRLVYYTSRKRMIVEDGAAPYLRGEAPAVFAFWHGRMLLMPMLCPPGRRMHVLISTHRDGEMIARTMHMFNFGTLRGSTTRGGATAAMQAVKTLQDGQNVSITPDGPRGPALHLQPGLLTIAAMANVPVVPMAYHAARFKKMRSWDKFLVPFPFTRLTFHAGAPLWQADKDTLETVMRAQLAQLDAA